METLELPVIEERDEIAPIPLNIAEQAMDIAAFKLWQEASGINPASDEEAVK